MPWQEVSSVSLREEFVMLAKQEGANIRQLCRRYGVSAKTGYKWLNRHREGGVGCLEDRSRRPKHSPNHTPQAMEEKILAVRAADQDYGGRKIRKILKREGETGVPSISTITEILRRHGRLDASESAKHQAFVRFEHEAPNDLWQMDFKGHFALEGGGRCHPLTVLDDHSRFSLGLEACGNQTGDTVKQRLTQIFRLYGLPQRMLMDNGSPWGSDALHPHTPLTAWLMRLGVGVTHSRPYHPQTQGKEERFHRTLKAGLLRYNRFVDLDDCQPRFDRWRHRYNTYRPHQALDDEVPASRYRQSQVEFPEQLPPIEYEPGDWVRKVQLDGSISFKGSSHKISKAFRGSPVAVRPTEEDGRFEVYYCSHRVGFVELRSTNPTPE